LHVAYFQHEIKLRQTETETENSNVLRNQVMCTKLAEHFIRNISGYLVAFPLIYLK